MNCKTQVFQDFSRKGKAQQQEISEANFNLLLNATKKKTRIKVFKKIKIKVNFKKFIKKGLLPEINTKNLTTDDLAIKKENGFQSNTDQKELKLNFQSLNLKHEPSMEEDASPFKGDLSPTKLSHHPEEIKELITQVKNSKKIL